ncbi:hypothetical protein GSI_03124 [Ganoderma sinense ZZ0214-1]|uniref:Uncharacterized protein n=1 Tax=Ganoderma sinense ZZ0214-1 TaxID=1077348 RepID=A0A2G8SKQ2_9APHY|nr:hypothetical protein GSI_03124 [Ganoderma sinense ZZ0214-1]
MGVFEPHAVRQQCATTIDDPEAREKFIKSWEKKVSDILDSLGPLGPPKWTFLLTVHRRPQLQAETRSKGWLEQREGQSKHPMLLHWIAEIVEYLVATGKMIQSSQGTDFSVALDPRWPIIGPNFEPPAYLHQALREVDPQVEPDLAYLKPCYVVHWIFHDALRRCPKCGARGKKLERNGWSPSGPREVHGLFREEMAIGIQFRCLDCAAKVGKKGTERGTDSRYSWTTTSKEFWENFEHWELPVGLPHFFSRSAVSSELFDFIVEMRLKSTSAGLAENIKQLHLLEYHKQHLLYLQTYRARSQKTSLTKQKPLVPFSKPLTKKVGKQTGGYDNRSISDDLITKILLDFSNKTRIEESEAHMRTLSAVAISVDTTFRCAFKATLVDKNKARVRSHNGGFVSIINEKSQPISWRLCHSQAQTETQEMLSGLSNRLVCLGLPPPEILTADNCCQHFLMRYLVCVKDGMKNPYHAEVANDIVDALLKVKAANGVPAVYRPQPEQEKHLVEVFNKWNEHGGVWSAAAAKVHETQLAHVQKGCLARSRSDIPTDGSRIEGSHKGWNSIMRAFSSGLEVMNALGHDHVLRHNVRLDMQDDTLDRSMFTYHTHSSHHIRLVNASMKLWNTLIRTLQKTGPLPANIHLLPELSAVDSRERFGLVKMSMEMAAQYSLATIKQEPGDDVLDLSSQEMLDPDHILLEIGVDPALLKAPGPPLTAPLDTPALAPAASPSTALSDALDRPSVLNSPPSADPKGKGVKRIHVDDPDDDDDIIELTQAQWGLPKDWFPSSRAARAASTTGVVFGGASSSGTSSAGALASTSFGMAALPAPSVSTVPTTQEIAAPVSSTPAAVAATTTASSSMLSVAPASGTPAIDPVLLSSGTPAATSATLFAVPGVNTPRHDDGPPPKKKASSKTSHKQRTQSQKKLGTLEAMFAQTSTSTSSATTSFTLTPTNEPCLPSTVIVGLTRSQRLFSVVTEVDPRALVFGKASSQEFFLFMELRVTHQWATFHMTPYDWVCAASTYNTAIKKLNIECGTALPLKTPHALLDKLSEVETSIFSRIRDSDYKSRSGSTHFWEHHCKAVHLGSKIQRMLDDATFKMNKNHTCGRCKRIMYPEGKSHKDNHPRNICSDGIRQSAEKVHLVINGISRDFVEQPPPFPQPKDVFTDGNVFHPARFMELVRTFYDQIVIDNSAPGALAMHDYAFAALLLDRTVIVLGLDGYPSKAIFKLFHSFTLAPGEAVVLDNHEGEVYLRMDCLSEPPLEVLQDAVADGLQSVTLG